MNGQLESAKLIVSKVWSNCHDRLLLSIIRGHTGRRARQSFSRSRATSKVVNFLLPEDEDISASCIWQDNLHVENVFVNPEDPSEIRKSKKEIRTLGIVHKDLRRDNVLWNEELGRALIIDFHRSTLKCLPTLQRPRAMKRRLCQPEVGDPKRVCVM
jgi:hypothetical protein